MSGINTNVASNLVQRNLASSQGAVSASMQRLSSGLRVNSSKDDAAGLAISERMTSQIRGQNVAARNANDAMSMAQTADGALSSVTENLQRMRELATQSANATNTDSDRENLNTEYQALGAEIGRVLDGTDFNGIKMLGNDAGDQDFQVGSGVTTNDTITVTTTDLTADSTITDVTGGDITNVAGATQAMTDIDAALETVSTERANMGSAQNRLDSVISNLGVSTQNATSSRGRILDTDYGAETANLARTQVLQQAGTAMLAQANALPNGVLSLLRG